MLYDIITCDITLRCILICICCMLFYLYAAPLDACQLDRVLALRVGGRVPNRTLLPKFVVLLLLGRRRAGSSSLLMH